MMKIRIPVLIVLLCLSLASKAQNERKFIREGVKEYDEKTFSESELAFRKALDADSTSLAAGYDMGNALYKQNKYKDAGAIYQKLAAESTDIDDATRAGIYHNLGNSYLKQGDFAKSIEAYKNALRLKPSDDETRYNLVYAQAKLQEQQQQQQKNQKDNKDQKNKDKQDQQNKDKQDQQKQQNQEEQNKQDQQQQQQQQQKDQDQNKKEQQVPVDKKQLSKDEVLKMLQAIQQQELQTLKKYEKQKANAKKVKTDKDW